MKYNKWISVLSPVYQYLKYVTSDMEYEDVKKALPNVVRKTYWEVRWTKPCQPLFSGLGAQLELQTL